MGKLWGREPAMVLAFVEARFSFFDSDAVVVRDFRFCLDVLDKNGAILFDDSDIIYNGLAECLRILDDRGVKYRANILPDKIFAIEIGDLPLHQQDAIRERLLNNHRAYLYSLQSNDLYRRFVNKKPFRLYRQLMVRLKGFNKFD